MKTKTHNEQSGACIKYSARILSSAFLIPVRVARRLQFLSRMDVDRLVFMSSDFLSGLPVFLPHFLHRISYFS